MSSLSKKLGYLRDRLVNAWWMIREGRFRLMVKSVFIELGHRREALEGWYKRNRPIPESAIPQSRFVNTRKVLPSSYRPTGAVLIAEQTLRVDREKIGADLKRIRESFELPDAVAK